MNPPIHLSPILLLVTAYGIGCFNAGYYLVRVWRRTDVRQSGSGSSGATNVARLLGWRGFAITLLLDALKGALAVSLARLADADPIIAVGTLVAVVAGHVWPVQLRFQGGKGIAAYLGALLCLDTALAAVFAALALVGYALSRAYRLAGLGAIASAPLAAWALGCPTEIVAGLGTAGLIILIAHRSNLREEMNKFRSPPKPGDDHHRMAKRE
jgi:acyl phosphate:glycerol-3-phosphate acyltransferase